MTPEMAVELMRSAVGTTLTIMAPILATAILTGLLVSLIQTVTSIQEQTLTFVPKMLAVSSALVICSSWMIQTLTEYSVWVIQKMPEIAR